MTGFWGFDMKEKMFARYPDLENKSVMITGGASGIGASLVAVSYTHLTLPTTPYV